jgi:hypothetical protein
MTKMDDECSRRKFLKKFAYLSGGALMLSATTLACYGPPPGQTMQAPTVSAIKFLDASSTYILLKKNQTVPVHTRFTIEFSEDMNEKVAVTIHLTDAVNNVITLGTGVWDTVRIFGLSPSLELASTTSYELRVTDAEDARGLKLHVTDSATADFKTA